MQAKPCVRCDATTCASRRWKSPSKPQVSAAPAASAVTAQAPAALAAPDSRPTRRASSAGITDAQLPAPAFLVPRPGAPTLSLPAGAARPSFRLHRSGSGSPPYHSRISQVQRLSDPTVPEAGTQAAQSRPLPSSAVRPGKDQSTAPEVDASLDTPFASADAVAAVRNEAKDKVRWPYRLRNRQPRVEYDVQLRSIRCRGLSAPVAVPPVGRNAYDTANCPLSVKIEMTGLTHPAPCHDRRTLLKAIALLGLPADTALPPGQAPRQE